MTSSAQSPDHASNEAAYASRPWLAHYAPGVVPDVEIPTQSIPHLIEAACERFPVRIATDFLGHKTRFNQLAEQISQAAEALRRLGVGPGDRVSLAMPNCPQHVVIFHAVLRLGAIAVEHNPLAAAEDLMEQIAQAGSGLVICWEKTSEIVAAHRDLIPEVRRVLAISLVAVLPPMARFAVKLPVPAARKRREAISSPLPDGVFPWEPLARSASPLDPSTPYPDTDDIAAFLHTGGTTGTPKAAMLTHKNILAIVAMGNAWIPELVDGDETMYAILPFFHAFGLTFNLVFGPINAATTVLFPNLDVDRVLRTMKRLPATFFAGVPPMFDRIAKAAIKENVSLDGVRYAISGAMSLPVEVAAEWERLTGGYLIEGYGMTETSPITVGNPISTERRPGALGLPFPSTEVRVCNSEEPLEVLPLGTQGELQVRGPQVFPGYWNNPAETENILLPDGWLRTGDIVVMDESGFITLVDRIKEIIITGGFNVYPSQVEDHLRLMPGIDDVAVVGVPSGDLGERVVAALVLAGEDIVDLEAIREWSAEHLARYATPREVVILKELPRTQLGKVLRRSVRDNIIGTPPPAM